MKIEGKPDPMPRYVTQAAEQVQEIINAACMRIFTLSDEYGVDVSMLTFTANLADINDPDNEIFLTNSNQEKT